MSLTPEAIQTAGHRGARRSLRGAGPSRVPRRQRHRPRLPARRRRGRGGGRRRRLPRPPAQAHPSGRALGGRDRRAAAAGVSSPGDGRRGTRRRRRGPVPVPVDAVGLRPPPARRGHALPRLREARRPCGVLDGVAGVVFAVWAPNARRVSVVGDFNGWDGRRHPMRLHPGNGIWELFLPGVGRGRALQVRDPVATRARRSRSRATPTPSASRPRSRARPRSSPRSTATRGTTGRGSPSAAGGTRSTRPSSVYEVHLGSWRRVPEEGNRFLGYREARRAARRTT